MKRRFFLTIAVALFFNSTLAASSQRTVEQRAQEHLAATQSWMNAIETVAKRSGHAQAIDLSTWMKDRAVIAMPNGPEAGLLQPQKQNRLLLISLLPGDEDEDDYWADHMRDNGFLARCELTTRTILFKDLPFNVNSKGHIGLHKLYHARHHAFLGRQPTIRDEHPAAHLQKEVEAHEFEISVAVANGGKRYEDLIASFQMSIKEELKRNNWTLGKVVPFGEPYWPQVGNIFGKAETQRERNHQMIQLRMAAYFRLLEEEYAGDVGKGKRDFIWAMNQLKRK